MSNYARFQLTIIICSSLVLVQMEMVMVLIICAGIEVEQIVKVRSGHTSKHLHIICMYVCMFMYTYVYVFMYAWMCAFRYIWMCASSCWVAGFAYMTSAFIFSPTLLTALKRAIRVTFCWLYGTAGFKRLDQICFYLLYLNSNCWGMPKVNLIAAITDAINQ